MIVKTIVIVAVSAGVSIAAVLSVLFVLDAYQQILLGEEYEKTRLAIEPTLEERHQNYKEVFETCETSPIVNDTESLLWCISSQMELRGDKEYVQINIWWNTIPEYREYQILYYDETRKCFDNATTIDECVGNADVYAREQSGFSNELLE